MGLISAIEKSLGDESGFLAFDWEFGFDSQKFH